jgi:hypothetical protein
MYSKTLKFLACLALLLALSLALPAAATAEDAPTRPVTQRENMLVLRNGQIIQGQVSRVGDMYYVALPHGEIRVAAAEVEFSCENIDHAYRRKRAAIKPGDSDGHLRLSLWCQRHRLLSAAAGELASAMAEDPNNPLIAAVERRLRAALEPKPTAVAVEPVD